MTPAQEQLKAALRMALEAIDAGALDAPAPVVVPQPSPFMTPEEAAETLGLRGSREYQRRQLRKRGRGKGWLREEGRYRMVVERSGFLLYVASLPGAAS